MTTDYNRYFIIDEVTMGKLLEVVELAELMARQHHAHLLDTIEFVQKRVANNTRIITGSQNIPHCAKDADFYRHLKDK